MPKLKIKKGDNVVVISGRDKGKTGEVLRVLPAEAAAHRAGRQRGQAAHQAAHGRTRRHRRKGAGARISRTSPMSTRQSGKPTRIGYKLLDDGRKVRVARRSGEVIDR